jgi:hypothetical protein
MSDKRIDTPTTTNPNRATAFLKTDEYREHLSHIHAHQCPDIDLLIRDSPAFDGG